MKLEPPPSTQQLLAELNRAKVTFQIKTLQAVLGLPIIATHLREEDLADEHPDN